MAITTINTNNLRDISSSLLLENGKLKLLESRDYDYLNSDEIRFFCHQYARYGLPTRELIDYIHDLIGGRKAIEIGSGHGDLGYHLKIPMTDSKIQENSGVRKFYEIVKQPVINYPDDVKKLEAIEAVYYYKPKVVIASWITQWINPLKVPSSGGSIFGIKEEKLLNLVDTYILVGNLDIHGEKEIMKLKHEKIKLPFIRSRASNPENDMLFIWNRS